VVVEPLPPIAGWGWAAAGGLVSALGAGLLFYAGLRRIPVERVGVLTYLEPLCAVLVGWAAFGEQPHATAIAGGVCVVAAGLLVVTAPPARS
jgi:drug/metabolite transporter (DMT)-like permease